MIYVWYVGSNRKHSYDNWAQISNAHLVDVVQVDNVKVSGFRWYKVSHEATATAGKQGEVNATIVYGSDYLGSVRVRIDKKGNIEVSNNAE